jgi:hypothetical protein
MTAKYLGILVGPGVTDIEAFAAPLNKYFERCRFIAKMGLGWVRAASLHNIFALPVLSYVAQVQGDDGLREPDLDRAAAILFRNPMYRPPFRYYAHLDELGCGIGLKDVRLECRAAVARCSLTLTKLPLARRQLAIGSDDDHLTLHPHRDWQNRCATHRLGLWHDQLLRGLAPLPVPPLVQKQCRDYLKTLRDKLNYHEQIMDRIIPILRRLGEQHVPRANEMATFLLDSIVLASANLHCTAMQALLKLAQNAFVFNTSNVLSHCSMCGAAGAARTSHLLVCGAVWVFLAESCPGLAWDFSAPDRWMFLFGSQVTDTDSAAMLALAWDAIHSGSQVGRFAGDGFDGAMCRLTALSKRPGKAGLLARAMMGPQPV